MKIGDRIFIKREPRIWNSIACKDQDWNRTSPLGGRLVYPVRGVIKNIAGSAMSVVINGQEYGFSIEDTDFTVTNTEIHKLLQKWYNQETN